MSDSRSKIQRLQAVRKQEAELARLSSKSFRSNKAYESKQDSLVIFKQLQDRQEKIQAIQILIKEREYQMSHFGRAHEEAQAEEKMIQEQMRAKTEFLKQAEIRAKTRGQEALKLEQETILQKKAEENYLKERRAEVLFKESEIAKEVAQKNRERQAILEEERRKEEALNYVRPGGTVMYGKIDYSKTHFHNPIILVHDVEGKNANQLAEEENEAAIERFELQQETKTFNEGKAAQRGKEALLEVAVKKNLEKLEKELEKIRKADGSCKIERGQQDKVLANRCMVKMTQEYLRKQEKMEKAFENIFGEIGGKEEFQVIKEDFETVKEKEEERVHEIPMPAAEKEEKNEEVEKKELKESQFGKYLVNNEPEVEETEDFEISQSEEDLMPAKYVPKASKKKKVKKSKKNESLSFKKPEKKEENPEEEFKDQLKEEYQKHLKIKEKIEELKKFSNEKNMDPPSVLSSQISPQSIQAKKSLEDDYSLPKKVENLGLYSKIKDEFREKKEKTPDSSLEEHDQESNSKNFLEEMKIKYGIQTSSKKSESSLDESQKIITEKNPIFSDRTLKLMKEIEEKYSLDKYNIKEDEDIRYTLPFAKHVGKSSETSKFLEKKQEISESPSEQSENDQEDHEEISHSYQNESEESSNIFQGKYKTNKFAESESEYSENLAKSEENYEISESYNEDHDEDLKPREKKPLKSSFGEDEEGKFSFNEKFFTDLKAKYGISDKTGPKDANFDFSPEKLNSEQSEESILEPKISKNKDLLIDDSENQGKSLADIFKERNKKAANKINERESSLSKNTHKEKSKEELAEIRKEQMRSKHEKEPEEKPENPLLERLGRGEKPKISKKEMHDLTKKNYEMLPEVKKRKEEERKKQELKERIQKSKEFEKVSFRQKRQEKRKS